jgi:hypothetical protein
VVGAEVEALEPAPGSAQHGLDPMSSMTRAAALQDTPIHRHGDASVSLQFPSASTPPRSVRFQASSAAPCGSMASAPPTHAMTSVHRSAALGLAASRAWGWPRRADTICWPPHAATRVHGQPDPEDDRPASGSGRHEKKLSLVMGLHDGLAKVGAPLHVGAGDTSRR